MNYLKSSLIYASCISIAAYLTGHKALDALYILCALVAGLFLEAMFWYQRKQSKPEGSEWIWGTWYGKWLKSIEVRLDKTKP